MPASTTPTTRRPAIKPPAACAPTKAAQSAARRADLAAIHALAHGLGMDTSDQNPDSDYRSLLKQVGGSHSAADMTPAQRRLVLRHFGRMNSARSGKPGTDLRKLTQTEYVARLWNKLGRLGALQQPTPAGLDQFVKTMTGIDSVRFLDTAQGNKVVEALKAWIKRAEPQA
jgi:phage gp16-like protein